MSICVNYSLSPENIFKLSDEQIDKYYHLAEKEFLGSASCGYISWIPLTYEDQMNPNFVRDCAVMMASEYYLKQHVNDYKNKKLNNKTMGDSRSEMKKQISIARKALDKIEFILNNDI